MLSSLARGYGSWTGDFDLYSEKEKTNDSLPILGYPEPHRHGITIPLPDQPTTASTCVEKGDGKLDLPKTYVTRKGALLLFSAPDDELKKPVDRPPRLVRHKKTSELIDLSLKLGTMERLSLSVLQYGEEDYDRETSSISDKNNKLFMKFLRKTRSDDLHSQPGGDLTFYLRDLKSRASGRYYGSSHSASSPKSQEFREILRELEEAWRRLKRPGVKEAFVNTNNSDYCTDSPTPSSRQRVLSSKKLRESLKSATYLGRPFSAGSSICHTDSQDEHGKLSDINSEPSPQTRSTHSRSGIWVRSETTSETEPLSMTTATRRFGSDRSHSAKSRVTAPVSDSIESSLYQEDVKSADHGVGEVGVGEEGVGEEDVGEEDVWEDHIVVEVDANRQNGAQSTGISKDEDSSDATHPLIPQYSGTLDELDDTISGTNQLSTDNEKFTMTDDQSSTDDQEWLEKMYRAREFSPLSTPSSLLRSLSPISCSTSILDAAVAAYKANLDDTDTIQSLLSGTKHDETALGAQTFIPEEEGVSQHNDQDRSAELDVQELLSKSESLPEDKPQPISSRSESESLLGEKQGQDLQTLVSLHHEDSFPSIQLSDSQSEPDKNKMADNEAGLVETDTQPVYEVLEDVQMAQGDDVLKTQEEEEEEEDVKTEVPEETTEISDIVITKQESVVESIQEESIPQESDDHFAISEEPAIGQKDLESELKEKETDKQTKPETVVSVPLTNNEQKVMENEKLSQKKIDDSASKDKRKVVVEEQKPKPLSPKQKEEKIPSPIPVPIPSPTQDEKPEVKVFEPRPPSGRSPKQKSLLRGGKSDMTPASKAKDSGKYFVKALDISSVQPDDDAEKIVSKVQVKPEKPRHPKKPPARHVETKLDKTKADVLPEHMTEVMQRRSASQSAQELEEEIMQMQEAISGALAGPTMEIDSGEGLSSEELLLAQEALQERMKDAKQRMEDVVTKTPKVEKPKVKSTQGKKGRKKAAQPTDEEKRDIRREREAIKEKQRMEKLKRLEEARQLQEQIASSEAERQAREEEVKRKAKEIQEEMEELEQEAQSIRQAEEDAHMQLQLARKADREERDRRRKEDLERKKQQAIVRREKQKAMMEEARKKEMEMLMQITDSEMKKQLEEEDRAKREDEELLAQERYEEELRQAQQAAEEEEHRMRELEKEAEEEAMRRLVDEREEAERQKWVLAEKQRQLRAEERKKQELMLAEERKLEEEKRKKDEEEERLREEQRKRLVELQRMEAEARENMHQEIERRREWALVRREKNLENRIHLDKIRHGQGITKPWVYSYFIQWPRETYNIPMGEDPKKQGFRAKPKPKPSPPTGESGETTAAAAIPAS